MAGVRRTRNPVLLARAIMDNSPHVMLAGPATDEFAAAQGLTLVEPDYFSTPARRRALRRAVAQDASQPLSEQDRHGTVGAVALDAAGNLAAATSTGGHTRKLPGRVGDSPIIGAGVWADNATCAVSGTGDGEFFMRLCLAHAIAMRVRLLGEPLAAAAGALVMRELPALGGSGGVIAVDRSGNMAMPFNTQGMYRGMIDIHGQIRTAIYAEAAFGQVGVLVGAEPRTRSKT